MSTLRQLSLFATSMSIAMACLKALLVLFFLLYFSSESVSKIVLPHKLRYLENMLNAEVVAKAAKIRQRMEANPNIADSEKGWPMLLAQYQADDQNKNKGHMNSYGSIYNRRLPNFK